MLVHWKNITAVAAASTALAVLLGWLFWPNSGTPSTAVPLEISTAAPTPPPLTAATRAPTEGLEVVLATLPDPDDDLGRGIVPHDQGNQADRQAGEHAGVGQDGPHLSVVADLAHRSTSTRDYGRGFGPIAAMPGREGPGAGLDVR
jgi:hypothetical protein